MALEFFTGFDHYATADLTLGRWTTTAGSPTITTSAVRSGVNGLRHDAGDTLIKTGLSNAATRIFAAAFRWSAVTTGSGRCFMAVADGDPTDPAAGQVGLFINGSAQIEARRNVGVGNTSAGTLLGTSTNTLSSNTWYFIELVVTVHNSAGVVQVWVNGTKTNWIDLTGVDSQQTGNAYSNSVGLGYQSGQNLDIDDVHTISGTGGTVTARLGDVKCVAALPDADGATNDFTRSTGASNFGVVDEAAPNGDTDYNESTNIGDIDLYGFANLANVGVIYGVNVMTFNKKTDVTTADVQNVARIGSTNYLGTQRALATSYGYNVDLHETSPATSAAWTAAEVNGAQFGAKHAA